MLVYNLAEAIVLIDTETSVQVEEDSYREVGLEEVFKKVKNMKGVKKIAEITGPHDIVAWLESDDIEDITGEMVDRIRAFEGVKNTLTNVVVRSE